MGRTKKKRKCLKCSTLKIHAIGLCAKCYSLYYSRCHSAGVPTQPRKEKIELPKDLIDLRNKKNKTKEDSLYLYMLEHYYSGDAGWSLTEDDVYDELPLDLSRYDAELVWCYPQVRELIKKFNKKSTN